MNRITVYIYIYLYIIRSYRQWHSPSGLDCGSFPASSLQSGITVVHYRYIFFFSSLCGESQSILRSHLSDHNCYIPLIAVMLQHQKLHGFLLSGCCGNRNQRELRPVSTELTRLTFSYRTHVSAVLRRQATLTLFFTREWVILKLHWHFRLFFAFKILMKHILHLLCCICIVINLSYISYKVIKKCI